MVILMNKLGYTKIELLVVIVLLGIAAFITISSTSYAFAVDTNEEVKTIHSFIENQAVEYANDHLDLFAELDTNFIKVSDLIKSGYLISNEEGNVTNPSNPKEKYNENTIKLEYNKDKKEMKATLIL